MLLPASVGGYRFSVCTVLMLLLGVHVAWAVGFRDGSVQVSEAVTSVVLVVERQSANTTPFTVDYVTVDESAIAGQDYLFGSGRLRFDEGECCQTIEVKILNDAISEDEEWFRVQLANVSAGHTLGSPTSAIISLQDNDVGVSFAAECYSVSEDQGVLQLMVERQTDDPTPFEVDFSTGTAPNLSGRARSGEDYVSASGTLQFAESEQMHVVEIQILNDGRHEESERFQVQLQNAQGITIATGRTEVLIRDNDPGIYFDRDYVRVSEGEPLVELTVWRGSDDLASFTLDYATSSRIPPEGGDYEPVSGTLSFGEGVLSETIAVRLSGNDSVWEGDEEFEVTLSISSEERYLATPSAVVVLVDDEPFQWKVQSTGEPLPEEWGWQGVTWGARRYVAVGDHWTAVSHDGVHWLGDRGPDRWLANVVWGNGEFVAVGHSAVWRSPEGRRWERVINGPQRGLRWVRYGEGTYVVADREGRVWNTMDLNNWTFQRFDTDLRGLAHGPAGFVLTCHPGEVLLLRPGTSGWQSAGSITDRSLGAVGWGEAGYVTVANYYGGEEIITEVLHSVDGVTWEASRLEGVSSFIADAIESQGEQYLACGGSTMLRLTHSAGQWTAETSIYPAAQALAYGGAGYVAAGWDGLYRSEDGLLWEKLGAVPLMDVVKVGEDFFVTAVVAERWHSYLVEVRHTRDWVNWVTETNPSSGGGIRSLVAQADKLVLLDGWSVLRTRGETGEWSDYVVPGESMLNGLASSQGCWVAVGTREDQTTGQRSGICLSSTDGAAWVMTELGFEGSLRWIEHAGEWFFTQIEHQDKPVSLQSRDGTEWQSISWEGDYELEWVTYGKGRYIANVWDRANERRLLLTSLDGIDWIPALIDEDPLPDLTQIEYGAGLFVGIGDGIFLSEDGLHWRRHSASLHETVWPQGVGYADGRFYVGVGGIGMGGFSSGGHVLISPPLGYLGSPQAAPNGDLQVLAEGAPGHAYSLEVSEDLVDWESLGPISIMSPQESVTLPGGDTGTGRRFYRWGTSGQQ